MSLETIATFDFLPEAEIARGRLLVEGIPCQLADQYLVQANWLYSPAVGGIKLQVEAQEAARAREVLARDYSAELD